MAKAANVSVATVSRVLNGTGTVAEGTKQRVLEAAKNLHYQPNLLGRHLRCMQTRIILVMLSSLANTFCSKVIRGIEKAASKKGYHIMVCVTDDSKESEMKYIDFVKNKLADGIIVLNSSISEEQMANLSQMVPITQCSEYIDTQNTPYVSIDNQTAAYDAVSYLIKKGRKNIVFLGVNNHLISSKQRLLGYQKALKSHHIPFSENMVLYGKYSYHSGMAAVKNFLEENIPIDALFAISDRMAAGAIASLKRQGVCVPDDVEVIGFDNTDITYLFEPEISTVAQPQQQLGAIAFSQLYQLLQGERPENVILPHKLVLRKSTT